MTHTRFTTECDVARFALAFPAGAVEAWDTGKVFQDRVTSDVLAAALAAAVVFRAKPIADQTESALLRLVRAALRDVDAWREDWSSEIAWYAPIWGRRETAWAVGEGFLPFGSFDASLWFNALQAFISFERSEAA